MMKALPVERVLTYNYHGVTFLQYYESSYPHVHVQ
jgi:hypothetical protein